MNGITGLSVDKVYRFPM